MPPIFPPKAMDMSNIFASRELGGSCLITGKRTLKQRTEAAGFDIL